ncbi:zf-TFIIB domain-containing protein [Legionella sp. CNM-1927-20]|uniref:TFIIB-type zinc ribbon-containing protein n=1 Tax=Legionella sp. CNM-1927-20 TaxID=3422221 RepID=UPI00403A993E
MLHSYRFGIAMSERQDYCPTCRGIWLDRGELNKMIDKESQPSSHSYDRHTSHYDPHYKKTRLSKEKEFIFGRFI